MPAPGRTISRAPAPADPEPDLTATATGAAASVPARQVRPAGSAPPQAGSLAADRTAEARVNHNESLTAIYSPSGGHLAVDGGHFAGWLRRLPAAARLRAA